MRDDRRCLHSLEPVCTAGYPIYMTKANLDPSDVSDLQREIVHRIFDLVRGNKMAAGASLRESVLARTFSVSRSPMRAALDYLCAIGVAEHISGRGYFLACSASGLPNIALETTAQSVQRVYNALVTSHIDGNLVGHVGEDELIHRFDVTERPLHIVLQRLEAQGLIAKSHEGAWAFSPSLKTKEDDDADMYRFRLLLEPASLVQPGFKIDPDLINRLRLEQRNLIASLDANFDVDQVFENNERLHGALIIASGNRFIINALNGYEPVGRMFEYRHYQNRERIRVACDEHIAILDAVAKGDLILASDLMRRHILAAQTVEEAAGA